MCNKTSTIKSDVRVIALGETVNPDKFGGQFRFECPAAGAHCKVPLNKDGSFFAIVDVQDFFKVARRKWHGRPSGSLDRQSVYGWTYIDGQPVQMGAYISGSWKKPGWMTDHRNGNPTDNRRCNLRFCTPSQNAANSQLRIDSTTGFKGVVKTKLSAINPYVAHITCQGTRYHIGCFSRAEEAATAYDLAARKLFGSYARTNKMLGLLK